MIRRTYSYDEDDGTVYVKHSRGCTCKCVCCTVLSLLTIVVAVVAGLLLAAFIRALILESPTYNSVTAQRIAQQPNMTSDQFVRLPSILGTVLTFPTIISTEGEYDVKPFKELRIYLEQTFSKVFSSPIVQVDDNFPSFLLTIQGSDNSTSNGSFLLLAHMDVVPVNTERWDSDPFGGRQEGGYVHGRGAIDDKLSMVAILCALDELLGSGWRPNITFYVAFGHDEEVGGDRGAGVLTTILAGKGVQDLFFILDEGMPVLQSFIKGVDVPVAIIGVTEKGWLSIDVTATGMSGHSSIPPFQQATHTLTTALHRIHTTPHPSMLGTGPEEQMLTAIAPKASWPHRLVLSNMWLFRPLVSVVMSQQRETDALQRTTTAITIIRAGIKDNVVPGEASAHINHRVHPGQTVEQVVQWDRDAIGDLPVNLTVLRSREPHPVSPHGPESAAFNLVAATVASLYPDAVAVPGLLVGNTDTRHYLQYSRNVYRFLPYLLTKEDIAGVHGDNERVSVDNVWRAARFYPSIMLTAGGGLDSADTVPGGSKAGEL